jgi:DNA-binding transcriptional LysR family regulator
MNLQQLRYVRALVEEGSFVAAASRCAVTQPTLSNGIAQLEADLGHRIFRRTTRSVALTAYGERILPSVVEALNAFERVRDLAKQSGKLHQIRIGISPCVGIRLAEVALEPAKSQLPDIEVIYRENNLIELCEQMKRAQLDIILAPLDLRANVLPDAMTLPIYSEPLFFIPRKSERSRWSNSSKVTVGEIAHDQFVLVPNACGLAQTTKRLFDDSGCGLNRYLGEASSYSAIEEWADLGLGSGILPASKISEPTRMFALPIVENGQPAMIRYFAIGKPSTIPSAIFTQIWETLQDTPIPSTTNHRRPTPAATYDWCV